MHESLKRSDETKIGSDRAFGLVFTAFFSIVGIVKLHYASGYHWHLFGLAALFGFLSTLIPRVLHPLNVVWFRFGLLLHHIVSPIILGLMFYTVFTPIGFYMRLTGKRPLNLDFDQNVSSYWVKREPPGPTKESFFNQF